MENVITRVAGFCVYGYKYRIPEHFIVDIYQPKVYAAIFAAIRITIPVSVVASVYPRPKTPFRLAKAISMRCLTPCWSALSVTSNRPRSARTSLNGPLL